MRKALEAMMVEKNQLVGLVGSMCVREAETNSAAIAELSIVEAD